MHLESKQPIASALLALVLVAAPSSAADKRYTPAELFQPLLGPQLAGWLIGPVARLATEKEIDEYLHLRSDQEATRYIEEFWARRDPDPARAGNAVRELYEARAAEADKKFTEATVAGRRTDRGTIHVLYGEPESIEYEEFVDVEGPDVELWRYPKKGAEGLDGRRSDREYRFAKVGDLTMFYSPRDFRDPRRRSPAERGFPSAPSGPSDPGIPDVPGVPVDPP